MASEDRKMTRGMLTRLRAKAAEFGDYAKVSAASGVPIGTLQKVMTGATDPRFGTVVEICRTIGLSLDFIITGIEPGRESGDWESPLGRPRVGEKRVPIRDVAASAGHGLEVFDEDPRQWFTFPLEWLATMGNPDAMDIVRVDGESMEPELRDGDHVMIDRSQVQSKDGLYVITVDDHLFVKRLQMMGRNRAMLASTNTAYRGFEIALADDQADSDEETSQDVARIVGRVVWSGRMIG